MKTLDIASTVADLRSGTDRAFATRLESAVKICARLKDAGFEAYLVGGAVRDLLMGRVPHEFDITTSADPDAIKALFDKTVLVGEAFGVVCVIDHGVAFEIATFRQEQGHSDGRHPDRVLAGTLEHDVRRRDFTVNGLVMDPETWTVIDLVGGLDDLASGVIRAIGDADLRLQEDYLRTLRAVRFSAVLGFPLDAGTLAAVESNAAGLACISRERVKAELEKMSGPGFGAGIRLIFRTGLAAWVFPFLPDLSASGFDLAARMTDLLGPRCDLASGLAALNTSACPALLGSAGGGDTRRWSVHLRPQAESLRLSVDQRRATVRLLWLVSQLLRIGELRLARRADLYRFARFDDAVLFAGVVLHQRGQPADMLKRFVAERDGLPPERLNPPALVSGEDLKALGLKPGPEYRRLLQEVSDSAVEGLISDRREALEWLAAQVRS